MGVRISLPVHAKRLLKLTDMSRIRTYIEETKNELVNKTSWPTWAELQSSALVVLVASIIIALVVFLMDFGFEKLMQMAYQLINDL